ncbi:hypothetical protein [Scytonema sp. NUACC26]|uniref:hypothetical protein n=1 Tax=Scytonema sp. NUACC26 TaxID=3140176 RepID=UPI0034DC5016
MKPSPHYDFSISVRCQTREEEPEVAALYQGIFDVILNHTVSVMFVPEFEINSQSWPPMLLENVDDISTELEARLVTVALSRYTVTPNSLLAGKEKIIHYDDSNSSPLRVIFFVTPEDFNIFSMELSMFAEQIPSLHDSRKVSETQNFNFIQFILARIITSNYFAEKDLQILRRTRVYSRYKLLEQV